VPSGWPGEMMKVRLSHPRVLPLTIVAMLLLLSVKAVTFAKDAGVALGLTTPLPLAVASPMVPKDTPLVAPSPGLVAKQAPIMEVSPSERALLQDLRRRREQLDIREHALDERNTVIQAVGERLQEKIDHLGELQAHIGQLDTARKERQGANWGGLVKIYESMKPRDAAAIFDVLDMHVLLEVLDRMNERKAGAVLAAMQPERARLATQMLAQMRLHEDMVASSDNVDAESRFKTIPQ